MQFFFNLKLSPNIPKNKNKQNKVPERQTDYPQRRHISGEQISHQQEQRLEATEPHLQPAKGMQFSLQ